VLDLPCWIFVQLGMRSDHHGQDWQDSAFAWLGQEERARDCAHDGVVAQHGGQLAARRSGWPAEVSAPAQPNKLTPFIEAIKQAVKADARRPRHERRTAKALYAQIKAEGYDGGYTRLTDFIRSWRQGEGQGAAMNAFVPLAFELGEAFQFDWSEEGLVVGGIDYRAQVAHMKLR